MRFTLASLLVILLAGCGSNAATNNSTPATGVDTAIPRTSPVATPKGGFKGRTKTSVVPSPVKIKVRTPTPIPATKFTSVVYGSVVNAKDKSPISDATVAISGTKHHVQTNAFGHYTLKYPSKIELALIVSAPGYADSLAMGQASKRQRVKVTFKLNRVIPGKAVQPSPPFTFGDIAVGAGSAVPALATRRSWPRSVHPDPAWSANPDIVCCHPRQKPRYLLVYAERRNDKSRLVMAESPMAVDGVRYPA